VSGTRGDDSTAALADAARRKAEDAPTPEQVQAMADAAMATGSADMSADEIRAVAREAVGQAEQVVVLLRRLAALTGGQR
jgi:hypothetical protein